MEITERLIKSLKSPRHGNIIHYDGTIPGFGVRVTAAGAVAFTLTYWIRGRQRRYTIGRHPEWSVVAAREKAKDLRYEIDHDQDPLAEREAARGEPTLDDLSRDYMTLYAEKKKRPSSLRNDRDMLQKIILPRIGKLRVRAVTRRDIEQLHGSLQATPYRANRVLALLSKMFTLAMEWKMADANPAHGVERYQEDKRETWLSVQQLREMERALAEYPDQEAADALRLLIVTGSRAGEVLKAEWSQFDLARGIWTKPSHHTKQKKIEHVPLGRAALQILRDLRERRNGSHYLFPGKAGPRITLRRPWIQVLKASGLTEAIEKPGKRKNVIIVHKPLIRIHDLRHTFASHLVSRGESLHKVGKLLGHTSPQTTARYAHVDGKALRSTADVFGKVYRLHGNR